jgi:lipoprotein-anchoring transpeptidase ErfK/SrfK
MAESRALKAHLSWPVDCFEAGRNKAMAPIERRLMRWTVAVLVASAEALAQDERGGSRRIVVSTTERRLVLLLGGQVVRTYNVAVGAPSTPTPSGAFQVMSMVQAPAWYQPGKVVPPGPQNPLGPRWIGLSLKGYGIHGTNSPRSIGGAKSHGCIRMRNQDVEELFDLVRIGDVVELRAEALEQAVRY